ncbi:hypothetical protein TSOC_007475 [Tetrabaena socialis]|uniref:Uncharacterized protein n=1 Tax=Tetrabaena socialis TaxID=47790 RepID=A0A2J8A0X5_9CHLO|nr:hypothetical protein TSOC_007475 [Tetrabaena socialis]|eukprot:PNH06164.1 hypothetical protein TSOC_007475 [Tetrabaena socialis]
MRPGPGGLGPPLPRPVRYALANPCLLRSLPYPVVRGGDDARRLRSLINGSVSGSSTRYSSRSLSTSCAATSSASARVRGEPLRVSISAAWLSGFHSASLLAATAMASRQPTEAAPNGPQASAPSGAVCCTITSSR